MEYKQFLREMFVDSATPNTENANNIFLNNLYIKIYARNKIY